MVILSFIIDSHGIWLNCLQLFGVSVFGLSVYMRAEEGFQEWVDYLEMQEYYIGLYILIIMSIFVMAVSFVSCVVTRNEFTLGLYAVRWSKQKPTFIIFQIFNKNICLTFFVRNFKRFNSSLLCRVLECTCSVSYLAWQVPVSYWITRLTKVKFNPSSGNRCEL